MKKKKLKKQHYIIIAFMSVFSVILMYPLAWTVVTAFKSTADIRMNRTKFFPTEWTLYGFQTAFEKAPVGRWFINSITITAVITVAIILSSTLIGYVFAKYEFRGKRRFLLLCLQR